MPRSIEAHDLELYAVNTGQFYEAHKNLAGYNIDEWAKHIRDRVLPRYNREIEPVTYDWETVANVAQNLKNYYETHARERLDMVDLQILKTRCAERDSRNGPRVGDFVDMPDGTRRRFTHHWGDGLQTTYRWRESGIVTTGSFYLQAGGGISYSGSLDDAIPLADLADTGDTASGHIWFFHHDEARASNGITVTIACRVYKQIKSW